MIQAIRMSAVVFFRTNPDEDSLDMYEESHSGQDNLRNVLQRSDMGNQRITCFREKKRSRIFNESGKNIKFYLFVAYFDTYNFFIFTY